MNSNNKTITKNNNKSSTQNTISKQNNKNNTKVNNNKIK